MVEPVLARQIKTHSRGIVPLLITVATVTALMANLSMLVAAVFYPTWLGQKYADIMQPLTLPSNVYLHVISRENQTEFSVAYHNPHPYKVHVQSVKTSCGCTVPINALTAVSPFASGIMRFKIRPIMSGANQMKAISVQSSGHSQIVYVHFDVLQ